MENLKGIIYEKNKNMDYLKVMVFYYLFKVWFYEYYLFRGILDGVFVVLLLVIVMLDIIIVLL